jgi:hypothetical protein
MSDSIKTIADAIDLLVSATEAAARLAPIIQKAQAEGRTVLTAEEWAGINQASDAVDAAAQAALASSALPS